MLFRKKQPRVCCYCVHGTNIGDGQILCVKQGVKTSEDTCRKYTYDPCKRIPPKPKDPEFDRFTDEDFSL